MVEIGSVHATRDGTLAAECQRRDHAGNLVCLVEVGLCPVKQRNLDDRDLGLSLGEDGLQGTGDMGKLDVFEPLRRGCILEGPLCQKVAVEDAGRRIDEIGSEGIGNLSNARLSRRQDGTGELVEIYAQAPFWARYLAAEDLPEAVPPARKRRYIEFS